MGAGDGAYCPHWQLMRPRGRLPRSLDPMHRVLEAGSTWRVVGWVVQVRGGWLRCGSRKAAGGRLGWAAASLGTPLSVTQGPGP